MILSLLVGSTFTKAVGIFTEGSRTALASPDLAPGMNPFDGILVPAFGSAYLVATLLLPFVAIRQIGADRDSGALKLLWGLGCTSLQVVARKFVVLVAAWALFLLVPASAALVWWRSAGHLANAELGGLMLGHLLYGTAVIALSLLAGSLGRSSSTSSLLVLAATLGSWVIDFEGAAGDGWVARLSVISLTQALRPLERGLLSPGHILAWAAVILMALGYAVLWLHPGRSLLSKALPSIGGAAAALLILLALPSLPVSWDLTEDRRHSFPPGVEKALVSIPGRLDIVVRLSAEDPRWVDLDRNVLRKLQRVVPHVRVLRTADASAFGRFSQGGDDRYGEVLYRYQGQEDISRSTSGEEVLPLIWTLTGIRPALEESDVAYSGYPTVLNTPPGRFWFRLVLPLLFAALWLQQHLTRPKPI